MDRTIFSSAGEPSLTYPLKESSISLVLFLDALSREVVFYFSQGFFFFFGKITECILTFKDSVVKTDMIIIFKNLELEHIQIFF